MDRSVDLTPSLIKSNSGSTHCSDVESSRRQMSFSTIGGRVKRNFRTLCLAASHGETNVGGRFDQARFVAFIGELEAIRIRSCFFFSVAEKKNSRRYIRRISVNYFPSNETCRTPRSLLIPPFPLCFVVIPTATGKERTQGESKSDENIPISERWSSVKRGQA